MASPITQENFTKKITPGINACQAICIHWWNAKNVGDTFEGIVHRLAYSEAPVSAHFVAEAGRVAQLAGWQQIAWHCATGRPGEPGYVDKNPVWIGIECNPRCDDGDVVTCAKVIADLWRSIGRKIPLVKHSDGLPTQCPGPEWSWWVDSGGLYKLAEQVYEGKDIDMATGKEVWNEPIRNRWGKTYNARDIFASMDKNIVTALNAAVEANERTKAIASAVAKNAGVDREEIEKAVKEGVTKALGDYQLSIAPKEVNGE